MPRPRLLERLSETTAPLIVLRAPAGYGKTALLAQWAAADEREFAWIGLGDAGDDPGALLDALAASARPAAAARACWSSTTPHVLLDPAVLALVADVAMRQGPGSTIAVATRGEPALPLGRLRVQGAVLELGAEELALTEPRPRRCCAAPASTLGADELATLCGRSEGWPAGLRLAALAAARAARRVPRRVAGFGGDDRFVADYLRDPCCWRSRRSRTQTSCAAARRSASSPARSATPCSNAHGSGELLRTLARSDLPLTALDRGEQRFRLHPLLAGMLDRRAAPRPSPELRARLHRRASDWHARAGDVPRAIDHALAAGDAARAGELLWSVAAAYATERAQPASWGSGSARFDDGRHRARSRRWRSARRSSGWPRAIATRRERWVDAAERVLAERPVACWCGVHAAAPGDRPAPSLHAGLAVLRAALARGGAQQLLADAERACRARRRRRLARAGRAARGGGAAAARRAGSRAGALELAARSGAAATPACARWRSRCLALVELEGDDREAALALVEPAVGELDAAGLGGRARRRARLRRRRLRARPRRRVEQARADAERGRRLLAALPDPGPLVRRRDRHRACP